MKDSVCIIIPTKDRRALLEGSIKSVFSQATLPDEVIVVNDGSRDDTSDYLKEASSKYSSLKVLNRLKNGGVNMARNQGIKESESEWIICLDDDDELLPGAIDLVKETISNLPMGYDLFYLNNLIITDTGKFVGGFQFMKGQSHYDPSYEDVMTKFGLRGDSSAIVKASVFKRGYWFPEDVNGFESGTIKKISRDGFRIRYYDGLLKAVNLSAGFEHLSFSSSRNNPRAFLLKHLEDLEIHKDFYKRHFPEKKYVEILKLALRSSDIVNTIKFSVLLMMAYVVSRSRYFLRFVGLQRWIRLGIRYIILLNLPRCDKDFSVPFFGYVYNGNLKDYIDKYVFYFGAYEREELLYLRRHIDQNSTILDIGANTGHHSLFFSRFAREVIAFEPYRKLFDRMQKRIQENSINNLKIFNVGLGSVDHDADFFAPRESNAGVGSFIEAPNKNNIGKLDIKKGDSYLDKIGVNRVDLIKIDVEGMEIDVLDGLKKTIQKFRPVMFVEMDAKSQEILMTKFKDLVDSYNLYIIDANNPKFGVFNIPGCRLTHFNPSGKMDNILFIPK